MTITFSDPQYPSKLPTRQEVLDFSIDSDVTGFTASLLYPSGFMETIYQGGIWGQFYKASTLVGSTFHVQREGGWPVGRFSLPMTESTAGAAPWAPIYDLDLTAQASQSMSTAGSYTIDGKTWWAKGSIPNGGLCALVNGSGLRLEQPASISTVVNWRGAGVGSAYAGRLLSMALSQIPDFNPAAPVAVQWRFASPNALSGNSSEYPFGGLGEAAASSAALTGADKAKSITVGRYASSSGTIAMRNPYAPTQDVISSATTGTVFGAYVQGVMRAASNTFVPLFGAYTTMGVPDDYQSTDDNAIPYYRGNGMSSSPSFIFGLEKDSSDSYDLDVYLTHLRVLQPKVA